MNEWEKNVTVLSIGVVVIERKNILLTSEEVSLVTDKETRASYVYGCYHKTFKLALFLNSEFFFYSVHYPGSFILKNPVSYVTAIHTTLRYY